MTTLLVGFDSAWTARNSGALVGVLQLDDSRFCELGAPQTVDYRQAEEVIVGWQTEHVPEATIILLDQPTVVKNSTGQRPVENLVASPVSRRYGGVQPANTSREEMFGKEGSVWPFLTRFGGAANPFAPVSDTRVIETYPVLTMIALGWMLSDARPGGRLPKYNPGRKKTFSHSDWQHVCRLTSDAFRERGLIGGAGWIDSASGKASPRKNDQDGLDACVCLLVALYLAEGKDCLMLGDLETGYIVVPDSAALREELKDRCSETGRGASEWMRVFRLLMSSP